ncbi:MAG: type I DNA topoisomerase [Endomicrobium sp.]|jgi:DNA topoisomerase-1|nr:type I DNA topoisomerase [Endomicrobium sp.]
MSKYLVIVESATKEKIISKILGKDFVVKSSYGHIRDLPKNKFGIDIEDNFKPMYVNMLRAKKIILDLKRISEAVSKTYLATDFDREGEAIAWHLKEVLMLPENKVFRITFNEITTEAILDAVKHPRNLDIGLINSQQTRRILDRLVGYKLSPFLWRKLKLGLSAGRVQSVAVMIICNRYEEIKNFVPTEYWDIEVELSKIGQDIVSHFKANIFLQNGIRFDKSTIKSKKQSDNILKKLKNIEYTVKSTSIKQQKRAPNAPYTTSTMQQDASRILGFSASKTMFVAQKLYEGINIGFGETGLITYIRTDSLNVAKSIQNETSKFIKSFYGNDFLPKISKIYKTKIKGAQEAHEAIRPTLPSRTPLEIKQYLSVDEFKLYDLIWKRFLASQMSDAVYNILTVKILAGNYLFKASESMLIFDGFFKVYNISNKKKELKIPHLRNGEVLKFIKVISQQHFTEPLAHYNEASLIKSLEDHGIGRPSTYAPIIKTILNKLYVRLDNKKFIPTNLGIVVNNILKNYFKDIINIEFTANIENKLDKIAEGKIVWQNVLKDFYRSFKKDLNKAEKNLQKQKIELRQSSEICPNCGKFMVVRESKSGQFLGCSGYPKCKVILHFNEVTNIECDKCGSFLIKRIGFKNKQYFICKNYPNCKTTYNIDKNGNKIIKSEPEYTDIKCKKCDSEMLKRIGKRGPFLTCSAFPKCRNIQWIKTPNLQQKMNIE